MSKPGKSRLSRLLPKFLRGDKGSKNEGGIDSKSPYCFIHFLDDSHHQIQIKGNWKGSHLQEKVCDMLSLHEKDYFGLRFIDTTGQTHWLDGSKSLSSQFKGCQAPHKLYFGVKFYAADPCKLREEITRYLFFLQVKQDILQGRLPVTFDEAAELCAYAVQSELGDYDPQQHTSGYVSEFCFVPNQTEELERRIMAIHRRLTGLVPMMAEFRYLDKVRWLDMYGVDLHPVSGEGSVEYFLGLTPTGIVVYKNKNKVGNYFWPRINKLTFKGKIFIIKVKDKNNEEHVYAFELSRKTACKHLWKCCVEHHAFFRLNQTQERSSREERALRSVSSNRRSSRSERQALSDNLSRSSANVLRLPSRRQARRVNSDSRLHREDNYESQYNRETGMVTMMMRPEPVKTPRHRSLPELQGHESPRSTKSAPWENNFDYGLYTHGKDSPVSERSQRMREQRSRLLNNSDSESGVSQRKKYFPNRRGSDNDSDVSFTRRRRRDIDSDSASDVSSRYPASHGNPGGKSAFPLLYPFHDKESRPNGSIPSLHSAPAGEAKQRRRRRRSKSPGKRPPEELKKHFEYGLKDTKGMSTEELKEIPFVKVETKAGLYKLKYSPKLRQKVKAAKQKSLGELDQNRNQVMQSESSAPEHDRETNALSGTGQEMAERESTGYNQSEVDANWPASGRPASLLHQPHGHANPHHTPHPTHQNPDSDGRTDYHHSRVPAELSYRPFHSSSPPPHRASKQDGSVVSQSSRSYHDRYADTNNSRLCPESNSMSQGSRTHRRAEPPHVSDPLFQSSRSPHYTSSSPHDTRSSQYHSAQPQTFKDQSPAFPSQSEAPHSDCAAPSVTHRSHHRLSAGSAKLTRPRSQAAYDSNNTNSTARRRQHRQDQHNDVAHTNAYHYGLGSMAGHDNYSGSAPDHMSQPPQSSSRGEGHGSRSGHRGEGHPEALSSYQYRDTSDPGHYTAPPPASHAAPPPYQPHLHGNASYGNTNSPALNYHQQHQQQGTSPATQRPASTLSPYSSQPQHDYHNAPSSHHPRQQHRPRSYGMDEGQRSSPHQYEGPRAREEEGNRSRSYNQEGQAQSSRRRGETSRSRYSFHEERPSRPPRSTYQGEGQYDLQTSGYQHQNTSMRSSPYQGIQSSYPSTPPRHQTVSTRQQETPPRLHADPRYSHGYGSREQSEGGRGQTPTPGGGSYSRSGHRADHHDNRRSGSNLMPDPMPPYTRSSTHNPDLCTEL